MHLSEPCFEMRQGTIPSEYLNDQRKTKACDMEYLYYAVFPACKSAEDEKDDPEEMGKHYQISGESITHLLLDIFLSPQISRIISRSSLSTLSSLTLISCPMENERFLCLPTSFMACSLY